MGADHLSEIQAGDRFSFGKNWERFLNGVTEASVAQAETSLKSMLHAETLANRTFLDIGSGSGLFSLAARRLGAAVRSFDYDPRSAACTQEMKRRFRAGDSSWIIGEGSILDRNFLATLGTFDIVYSWGVLHHTGNMMMAFENAAPLVSPSGQLFIAIYNDQGLLSKYWNAVKKLYNKNRIAGVFLTLIYAPYLFGLRFAVRFLTGRLADDRGMALWHDMIDWLGGYPFEVAKPEDVFRFFHDRGFVLEEMKTCGGRSGCNEFVFRRIK